MPVQTKSPMTCGKRSLRSNVSKSSCGKLSVPTITLEGDANGAPHPEPPTYAGRFTGPYEHRSLAGGIGHNLPQEAPRAFAAAVRERIGRGTDEDTDRPSRPQGR